MSEIDLDALEKVAKAATEGPWDWYENELHTTRVIEAKKKYRASNFEDDSDGLAFSTAIVETDGGYYGPQPFDREHIAAFDPPTVLSLIEAARERDALVEALRHADEHRESKRKELATLRAQLATAQEALERIVETGTRSETVRIGDMYDLKGGYEDHEITSKEAEIAREALAAITPEDPSP